MTKFIAEVSSNHNSDIQRCRSFIDEALKIGCDAVKFQLFKLEELFAPEILEKSEDHRKRKQWELPLLFIPELSEYCHKKNIEFGCTPFYLDAVEELEPYVDFYKIASYELLWNDLLIKCAKTGKPVIISSGMATMPEIKDAVNVLKSNGCKKPTVLHCTSAYPTPYSEANLKAIETIRFETGCKVGWSDHTVQPSVINRAINKWNASVIEFHIDLEGFGTEYDSGHCWLPNQIKKVIGDIRKSDEIDGDGIKQPSKSEKSDRDWRADPIDGMRPFKSLRENWKPKK